MPFETGLALRSSVIDRPEPIASVLLDEHAHRPDRSISDPRSRDAEAHRGSPKGLISAVLGQLAREDGGPAPKKVDAIFNQLAEYAENLKKEYDNSTVFHRAIYLKLVIAAVKLAEDAGLIRSN
jgi:hypothetical protein